MHQLLKLHPKSRCAAVTLLEVDATRQWPDVLQLNYSVSGAMADLRIPAREAPARADELWRHTCFEAFVRPSHREAYYEFNFAPSLHWAAYQFNSYRSAMRKAGELREPEFEVRSSNSGYELRVALQLSGFSDLRDDVLLQLNLAAVIEEASGRRSYWALAHAPGKADFHRADCFILDLPAA